MWVTALRVDEEVFELAETVDVEALKDEVLRAVDGHPAFVDVTGLDGTRVSLLVTPAVRIRFERFERTEHAQVDDPWLDDTLSSFEWDPVIYLA